MSIKARPQPFPLIQLEGPPRERGYSYGRQAGERIEAGLLARYGMNGAGVAFTANGLQRQLDGGHIEIPRRASSGFFRVLPS